jgi:hypothetical protein
MNEGELKIKILESSNSEGGEKDKDFGGDLDFIIPDLTKSELDKVIENKKISTFIFSSNIKDSENYDILGEIKESVDDYHKNIDQLKKYIKLYYLFKKEEEVN